MSERDAILKEEEREPGILYTQQLLVFANTGKGQWCEPLSRDDSSFVAKDVVNATTNDV